MDRSTHEVRLANWKAVIEQCQARPEGQSARQWLAANNIPEKKYYYWLRRVRKATLSESQTSPAVLSGQQPSAVSFFELQSSEVLPNSGGTAVKLTAQKLTLEISASVSENLMVELVKAVAHAL